MTKTTAPAISHVDIVSAIARGNNRSALIAEAIGVQPHRLRALDKALQKAKKDGMIEYNSLQGWRVVSIDSDIPVK